MVTTSFLKPVRRFAVLAVTLNALGLAACSVAAEGPTAYRTYHFSDCQEGAAAGCVPGNNGNRGTAESPKQNLSGIDVNSLPAGSRLLFKRGGAWANVAWRLENTNATPTTPLVFDAYGAAGAAPLLRSQGGNALTVGGGWGNTGNDGGYLFRNLKLDGTGKSDWGVWLVQNVRNVTLENMDITGFKIGVHSSQGKPHGVTALVIKNSRIHRNSSMGMLGSYDDSVIEGNTFDANNFSGSAMNHAIYLSGGSRNTIRGNTFDANSTVDGVCQGGNVTAHGLIDGLLIEGNTIRQAAAKPSCYGFAITVGYESAESFRNVVLRGNTIINVGMTAIAANAAPGIVVEGNKIINTQDTAQYGIWIPANRGPNADDAQDRDAVVRNNTVCYANADKGAPVSVKVPGAQVGNNTVVTGAAAKACETRPAPGK